MSEKEGCTRTDCSQQTSKAGTTSSATEEISAACSPFHLVLWRENFYSCCPFECAEWQSLCSVISKETARLLRTRPTFCKSLMVSVAVSSNGATQLHFLEPRVKVTVTGIQCCWICFCRISVLFSGITTFFSKMGHRHIVHVTRTNPHHAAERDARVYPSRDVATQFARFESGGLQHLGYPSRQGLPLADPWCEWVERTYVEGVEAAGPHRHRGSDCAVA